MRRLVPGLLLAFLAVAAALQASVPRAVAAEECANEAIRQMQESTHLPDCRAFEQVTPRDKGAAEVDSGSGAIQAAPNGEAIAFSAPAAFPGSQSSVVLGMHRSARDVAGWSTTAIDLPQTNLGIQMLKTTRWISEDLNWSVASSALPLAPGALPGYEHVYVNNLVTGERRLAFQRPDFTHGEGSLDEFNGTNFGQIAGDVESLRRFVFEVNDPLVEGASPNPTVSVYEWVDGDLRLLSRQINGDPNSDSAQTRALLSRNGRAMSADGSKVFFWTMNGLYVRENGTATKLLSASQKTGDDPTLPISVDFNTVTPDGRYAFFSASSQLTDEPLPGNENETVGSTGRKAIYRYDLNTGEMKAIGLGGRLLAVSDDGRRLYFDSRAKLAADAEDGALQAYLWDDGTVSLLGRQQENYQLKDPKISPDGRYAQFMSAARLTPDAKESPRCPAVGVLGVKNEDCLEIYAYDAATDQLRCLSCVVDGSIGHSRIGDTLPYKSSADPNSLLADGTYFFDTPNALVPTDTNERQDVYEWKDGVARLLTSGTSNEDASFRDASADGRDVFFLTRGKLVAQDYDENRDLYDVRRGGGFAAQNTAETPPVVCSGDGCQDEGALPAPPKSGSSVVRSAAALSTKRCGKQRKASTKRRTRHARGAKQKQANGQGRKSAKAAKAKACRRTHR